MPQTQGFGPKDLKSGKVMVVNFFSSTCAPCRLEAPVLNQLAQMPGITLYGYVWKDKPEAARAFLNEVGNPFSRIGMDTDGRLGMNWGVRGWPETFVVDGHGIIRFKYDESALTPRNRPRAASARHRGGPGAVRTFANPVLSG